MATTEQFNITYTGTSLEGNSEDLSLTITVDTATSTDGSFTGHLITAVSGTMNGNAVTLLPTGSHGYDGNDNLFSPTGQAFDLSGFAFSAGGDKFNLYWNGTHYALTDFNGTAVVDSGTLGVTCFVTGTRIRTTRGEVAVEDLAIGNLVLTASGEARPVKWIGSRTIQKPIRDHWPIKVTAGSFGDNRPARDLFLSPGHAVCVKVMDEVFVPVGELVNGATITPEEMDEVTYWHVELESHDVLLAEGLACESYLEMGNREWFAGGEGAPDPERVAEQLEAYARPLVAEGPVIEALRERLTARAETQGWTRVDDVDLHLVVDGARVEPVIDDDLARFIFPADAKRAALVSRTFSPSWSGQSRDQRELGVMVKTIDISDGLRVHSRITPDHPALGEGFHGVEINGEEALRWTSGRGDLPAVLWEGCKGQVILTLAFNRDGGWAWKAPARSRKAKIVPMRAA